MAQEHPDRVRAMASVAGTAAGVTAPVSFLGAAGFVQNAVVFDVAITGAVAVASGPFAGAIQITTAAPHGLSNGNGVFVASVGGTVEANSAWPQVSVSNLNTGANPLFSFILIGSAFVHAYTSGGTATPLNGSQSVHYTTGSYWLALADPLAPAGALFGVSVHAQTNGTVPMAEVTISTDGTGVYVITRDAAGITADDTINFTLTAFKAPSSQAGQ